MGDELGPAIMALQQKLSEQQRAVADTKRTINILLKMAGQNPIYSQDDEESSSSVRADQFYGKGLATSAAEYLAMRKQACQPEEILRALAAGGFDFDLMSWRENDRLRSFTISLAKNTGTAGKFHRLKNGSFGLRSWYDEEFLRKAAAGAEAAAKSARRRRSQTPVVKSKAATAKGRKDKPKLVKAAGVSKEKGRSGVRPQGS